MFVFYKNYDKDDDNELTVAKRMLAMAQGRNKKMQEDEEEEEKEEGAPTVATSDKIHSSNKYRPRPEQ